MYLHCFQAHPLESSHCNPALRVRRAECYVLEVGRLGRRREQAFLLSDELAHGIAEHGLHLQCSHCHVFRRIPQHCYFGLAIVKRLFDADASSGYLAELLLFFLSEVQDEVVADRHLLRGSKEKMLEPSLGLLLGLVRGACQTDVRRGNSAAGVLISQSLACGEETPSTLPTPSPYLGLWKIEIIFGRITPNTFERTQRTIYLNTVTPPICCVRNVEKLKMVSYHVRSSRVVPFVGLDSILLQKPTQITQNTLYTNKYTLLS